jgi:hypothetical protein
MDLQDMKHAIVSLTDEENADVAGEIKEMIARWHDPPEPLEILNTIQAHAHGRLPTTYVIDVLDELFSESCSRLNSDTKDVIDHVPERIELKNCKGSI